ncbi:MAG: hypothetical protein ACXVCV_07640 [Polyangia bacterium]
MPLISLVAGCTDTHFTVLPYPIPLELSGPGGGLMARASVDATTTPFPIVVDTGTILTTYDDGSGSVRAFTANFTMFGVDAAGTAVPRLTLTDVQLFEGPLGSLGVGAAATHVGGVIGGNNLSRFAVAFDYRGPAPTMTLSEGSTQCDCELAPACDRQDLCYAALPFTLAGGQDTTLQGQTRITIGQDQYSYPPTRVMLDACLEPLPDPVATTACVLPGGTCPGVPAYVPSGVDVKLVVASGFPGVALSANAYDRLHGAGSAAALLAGGLTTLHLVDPADEGPTGAGVQVATATLGRTRAGSDAGASPLALVSGKEPFFGPCASLARSRRIRRAYIAGTPDDLAFETKHPGQCSGEHCCLIDIARPCGGAGGDYAAECQASTGEKFCNDSSADTPAAAVVELKSPMPIYVMPDVTPLLVGINADVRPTAATVDGVIGTEALKQLVASIDYPASRFVAQCVREDDCVAYPRLSLPSPFDCGFCQGPKDLRYCPELPGMRPCPPAP